MFKTELTGNVTRDCESRVTQAGINVCSFTVAVNGRKKDDETIFVKVTAWRSKAELCAQYVKKGMKVYVEGRIEKPKPYTSNSGELRCDVCLTLDDIEFLSRADGNSQSHSEDISQAPEVPKTQANPQGFTDVSADFDSESLPF